MEFLKEMSKNELIEFIKTYNEYVIETLENTDNTPVCVGEFYYNDYELWKNEN